MFPAWVLPRPGNAAAAWPGASSVPGPPGLRRAAHLGFPDAAEGAGVAVPATGAASRSGWAESDAWVPPTDESLTDWLAVIDWLATEDPLGALRGWRSRPG